MDKNNNHQHPCTTECIHRYQTEGLCVYGKREIPHPKDNNPCLYSSAILQKRREVDYKEIAAHKWGLDTGLPANVQNCLRASSRGLKIRNDQNHH